MSAMAEELTKMGAEVEEHRTTDVYGATATSSAQPWKAVRTTASSCRWPSPASSPTAKRR